MSHDKNSTKNERQKRRMAEIEMNNLCQSGKEDNNLLNSLTLVSQFTNNKKYRSIPRSRYWNDKTFHVKSIKESDRAQFSIEKDKDTDTDGEIEKDRKK